MQSLSNRSDARRPELAQLRSDRLPNLCGELQPPLDIAVARGMPRYFFHLYDDIDSIDEEGTELPDIAAATKHAITQAKDMACAEVLKGHLSLRHRIEVTDEAGMVLLTVRFKDVVEVQV